MTKQPATETHDFSTGTGQNPDSERPAQQSGPIRMCVICRRKLPKAELIRHVSCSNDFQLDLKQRAAGRGFYTCPNELCLERFKKYRQTAKRRRITSTGPMAIQQK